MPPTGPVRATAAGVLALRIAYGAALIAAPTKLAGNRWLGPGAASAAARVPLRGVGGREIAVHGAGLATLLRGGDARPWLLVSIAGDLADIAATASSRNGLPEGSAAATAIVAGGSALLSAAVALLLED